MENLGVDRPAKAGSKDDLGANEPAPEDNLADKPATDDQVDRDIESAQKADEVAQESDARWIEKVALTWRSHLRAGLDLRFKTGKTFNKRFGPPDTRFPHGEGVAALLAEQTGLSVADISRFRWFAHHFSSFADFQEKHPKVTTWEKVKLLLVELRPKTGKKASQKKTAPSSEVQIVLESLDSVTKMLHEADVDFDEDSTEDLAASLRKLGRALRNTTGFSLSFSPPEETPDD